MGNPITIELCPHKANPKACPTCFRMKPPEPKKAMPAPQAVHQGIPTGQVMSIGEATMRATQRRVVAPAAAQGGPNFKEPYHEADTSPPPQAHSNETLWQPKSHQSLIDRQPKHPHLDKGRASFMVK